MNAQPLLDPDPDDPVEIRRALPEKYVEYFLADYAAAVQRARDPEHYPELRKLLRLWRLRAVMYSQPGYEEQRAAVAAGTIGPGVPLEQVVAEMRAGSSPDR